MRGDTWAVGTQKQILESVSVAASGVYQPGFSASPVGYKRCDGGRVTSLSLSLLLDGMGHMELT